MNWIKNLWQLLFTKSKKHRADNQDTLMLLVCVPCFITTAIALVLAQVSPYLIAFILIVLLLLCSFVMVASKQNSQYQIRTLSNLIESMIDGDYTLRGRLQTDQAFQELLNSVNVLADTLSKHKVEAKESRLLLERIMEQMDAMVLATDEQGFVVMANASAHKLVLGTEDHTSNNQLNNIQLASLPIGAEIISAGAGIINFKNGSITGEHFLSKESFLSDGEQHQLYTLTNAERLLMEKERKAWQSLLRVLSHEMNNSLTPIVAISQSMQKRLQSQASAIDKESLLGGVNIIHERADSLSQFIASYSQLSQLPKPNKSVFKLVLMIDNLATLYPRCKIQSELDTELLIEADKGQLEQVLINLFKNSLEAMSNIDEKVIEVSSTKEGRWQHISIRDFGSGIANLDNVFVPFYTTKSQGSGIGLALCRQILFNHNGSIKIDNYQTFPAAKSKNIGVSTYQGVEVVLSFPVLES
ncbi:sensor histidine kinase [Colwellia psychrerythraea]|uniref:histidine kinase n=1 Tax=Colwellia psychrerythraea TaxID=28229 RepID=A0A099KWB0_COLPS|nr:ATP-binding protein [Colwellia psychrerythraea]KGJ94876.1 ATP-binding region ATPase domain protein [Colwellia psychrerythraea]